MEAIMELNELKQAWQTLGRQLEQRNAIELKSLRDSKLEKVSRSLKPLFWGQVVQILFGACFIFLAGALWLTQPTQTMVIAAGIVVHAYGVAIIIAAGVTLSRIHALDYTAPVLTIARQMAGLRRAYLISGMAVGLPWWLLWVVVLMVLAGLGGVDLSAQAPWLVWPALAGGVIGLLATRWFHHWSRHPKRAELGKRLDDSAAGGSIRRGQRLLDEIAQFERE